MAPKRTGTRRSAVPDIKPARRNQLLALGLEHVHYTDTNTLRTFISDRGKIRSRRVTGLTVQQQREVATAIKTAREMALLPYPGQRGRLAR
jgi:small subunit ribosomal protein S18